MSSSCVRHLAVGRWFLAGSVGVVVAPPRHVRSANDNDGPVSDRDLRAAWFTAHDPQLPIARAAGPLLDDPLADGWFR